MAHDEWTPPVRAPNLSLLFIIFFFFACTSLPILIYCLGREAGIYPFIMRQAHILEDAYVETV